jgi:hypothetical protein
LIYFCIPALNEERTVGVVLWKLRQIMTELQRDFQIIVVDDASTDATQEVLSPYTRVLPLTLIRNEQTLGYAAALEMAIREAVRRSPYPKRDALITLQADFTEDPDTVPALIKRIEAGADLVTSVPTLDEATPANLKRARRLFKWLVGKRAWAELGDPFSGLRAYRVMTIKRAMEARGTTRLLSWEGWAANAELLTQAVPHSRRNDIIETTVHYKRLQRASRFRFLPALSSVLGMRSGKPGKAAPVPLPDSTIVVPAALAVELADGHQREAARRKHEPRRGRPAETRTRGPRKARPERPAAQAKAAPIKAPPVNAAPVTAVTPIEAPTREKRRRRPRRRSRKPSQRAEQQIPSTEAPQNGETVVIAHENGAGEAAQAPRKKSRRGRRGGRGRKRGPRPNIEGQIEINEDRTPESAEDAS